ncbi:VanZ family protein [Falsirhodobacter sp. 20TX0035]|uniref:VanZ family protein n=1 Tax=Falsirhodobacter sp. 20TX0035 TaxID=3022019 RepID=UPI002330A5E5|nr:VanZ family protein [Falsirhodobacter sp. 20TX0035]MDB6453372.1 VanZ family protein [Falsirhodobacter sp. 20TX0035]
MTTTAADKAALLATSVLVPLVGYLTLTPGDELPVAAPGNDKINHALAWAAMSFPLAAARPQAIRWILPVAVAYGIAVEILQPLAGRSQQASDVVADTFGALAGCGLGWLLHRVLIARR